MITWHYVTKEELTSSLDFFKEQMEDTSESDYPTRPKPQEIDGYVLGQKIPTFKMKLDTGIEFSCYGTVRNKSVIFLLWLKNEPKTNADIPEFPRQVFQLNQ
jgi:hypothetical protein